MNIKINDAINFYNNIFKNTISNEFLLEKYNCYYEQFLVPIWNTIFHNNSYYSFEDIVKLYEFYKQRDCQGYFLSFDDRYLEHSVYNGTFFYLKNSELRNSGFGTAEFTIKEAECIDEFGKILALIFEIDEKTQEKVQNLLSANKTNHNRNYFAFLAGKLCGIATFTINQTSDAYLSNLGILPEFRKKNLAGLFIQQIAKIHPEKNIYSLTAQNGVLTNYTLPNLGFKKLGDIHLINLQKMYETIHRL